MFCACYGWARIQIFFVKELWIQLGKMPLHFSHWNKMYRIIVQPCLPVKWNIICKATNRKASLSMCSFTLRFVERKTMLKSFEVWHRVVSLGNPVGRVLSTLPFTHCFQEMAEISHLYMNWKRLVLLAMKLLFKYTIHSTTETVLPNLSKYSHMLKDGINIIYC